MSRTISPLIVAVVFVTTLAGQEKAKTPAYDMWNDIEPEHLKVDVPALITVKTRADVDRVRKELIAFIWRNDGALPTKTELTIAPAEPPKMLAQAPAACETWTVDMGGPWKSVMHFFRNKNPNKRLAIVHQGHDNTWTNGGIGDTAKFMLEKGYDVLAPQMPLMGHNGSHRPAEIRSHFDMEKLVAKDNDPIRYFVEPITVGLNHGLKKHEYSDVVMIGLSGGGWTTTLYAAIDPRVRLSFPVAGTLPLYLRTGTHRGRDVGDWEQYYPQLYKIAEYLDLYVMGATGPGRRQRQVINKFDSCCFAGVRHRTYEDHVKKTVKEIGGQFDIFLDESHRSHMVSPLQMERAIGPVLDEPKSK